MPFCEEEESIDLAVETLLFEDKASLYFKLYLLHLFSILMIVQIYRTKELEKDGPMICKLCCKY